MERDNCDWMKRMRKKLQKTENWIYCILSVGLLGFLAVAMHDVQRAQGIGLYYSIQAGADSRIVFDLLVDVTVMVAVVLLLIIPCMVLKRKKPASFLRLLVTFLAFMPRLSLAYLVHLDDTVKTLELRPSLKEGALLTAFLEGTSFSVSLLQMVIPMFFLLVAALSLEGKEVIKRWYLAALLVDYDFFVARFGGAVVLCVGIYCAAYFI